MLDSSVEALVRVATECETRAEELGRVEIGLQPQASEALDALHQALLAQVRAVMNTARHAATTMCTTRQKELAAIQTELGVTASQIRAMVAANHAGPARDLAQRGLTRLQEVAAYSFGTFALCGGPEGAGTPRVVGEAIPTIRGPTRLVVRFEQQQATSAEAGHVMPMYGGHETKPLRLYLRMENESGDVFLPPLFPDLKFSLPPPWGCQVLGVTPATKGRPFGVCPDGPPCGAVELVADVVITAPHTGDGGDLPIVIAVTALGATLAGSATTCMLPSSRFLSLTCVGTVQLPFPGPFVGVVGTGPDTLLYFQALDSTADHYHNYNLIVVDVSEPTNPILNTPITFQGWSLPPTCVVTDAMLYIAQTESERSPPDQPCFVRVCVDRAPDKTWKCNTVVTGAMARDAVGYVYPMPQTPAVHPVRVWFRLRRTMVANQEIDFGGSPHRIHRTIFIVDLGVEIVGPVMGWHCPLSLPWLPAHAQHLNDFLVVPVASGLIILHQDTGEVLGRSPHQGTTVAVAPGGRALVLVSPDASILVLHHDLTTVLQSFPPFGLTHVLNTREGMCLGVTADHKLMVFNPCGDLEYPIGMCV